VSQINDYQEAVEQNLRKIKLCRHVIDEVHRTLIEPLYPEDKADLLLATEYLLDSIVCLTEDVSTMVWQNQLKKPTSES
jgi:hypothetical protein